MKTYTKEEAKELSLISIIIHENEILNGKTLQIFDQIHLIAEAFLNVYGTETKWGIDVGLEYEEKIIVFATEYSEEKGWII